jgi:hypothetical protein
MAARKTAKTAVPSRSALEAYVAEVLDNVRPGLVESVSALSRNGSPLPDPADLAVLIRAGLPTAPATLDPHFADAGPFYDSKGAQLQLGGVTKQALDSRRHTGSVLAMRTGDGHWLYPAWQFTGQGGVHPALAPVFKALRLLDGWSAAVWLISDHPDFGGKSPRRALRGQVDPDLVAEVARQDALALTA